MLGTRGHEDGLAPVHIDLLPFDLEGSAALQHDVDLVVLVRLLTVGLGRHEHVYPELETRRLVDDLVASAGGS